MKNNFIILLVIALILTLTGCSTSKDMAVYGVSILDLKVIQTDCSPCGKGRVDNVTLEKDGKSVTYNITGSYFGLKDSFENVISLSEKMGIENKVDVIIVDNSIQAMSLSRNRK